MGKDIENLLTKIDGIKPIVLDIINTLTEAIGTPENSYNDPEPTATFGSVGVDDWGVINSNFGIVKTELDKLKQRDKDLIKPLYKKDLSNPVTALNDYLSSIKEDTDKFSKLQKKMFSKASKFFNSLGSPFSEYDALMDACKSVKTYASSHSGLKYLGEKISLLSLVQPIIPCLVDFKIALITYNDYIQRGYDNVYNDNKPSITIQRQKNKKTTGNIQQKGNNNVEVPQESIDPY